MKSSVRHIRYGRIEYDENFWTGKRELTVRGKKLQKVKRNVFKSTFGREYCVKGNFLTGATLHVGRNEIQLSEPCKWYEIFCSVLIAVFVMTWGNIPALCMIFPMVGGLIGGAIAGLGVCTNLYLMKHTKGVGKKLLVCLGVFLGTVALCFLVAILILMALA